jgi:hypothetical protein
VGRLEPLSRRSAGCRKRLVSGPTLLITDHLTSEREVIRLAGVDLLAKSHTDLSSLTPAPSADRHMTPSSRNPSTSAALMSSQSPKTCAVCSPNRGDDLTGAGAPSKSTGKAGMRNSPFGCCIV